MVNYLSKEQIEQFILSSPFHEMIGIRFLSADTTTQVLRLGLPFSSNVERSPGSGQFHGGAIASLIDIAGDFALIWTLGVGVPTINFRTDYLCPATGSELVANAKARRIGRSVGVVDIDIVDDVGRVVALGRGCYGTRAG